RKTKHVPPVFPPEAYKANISGVVIIEATIGADGRVSDTKVLRSIPLLDQPAVDAVRQWEFEPTLLNGVAVPVIMTVTVTFTLEQIGAAGPLSTEFHEALDGFVHVLDRAPREARVEVVLAGEQVRRRQTHERQSRSIGPAANGLFDRLHSGTPHRR